MADRRSRHVSATSRSGWKALEFAPAALAILAVLIAGAVVLWSGFEPIGMQRPRVSMSPMSPEEYERWAREHFLKHHPDEKPLNWAIARTAVAFHKSKPMGKFVLHENDCSDFVGCIVDHALGAGARFERNSEHHALCGAGGSVPRRLFRTRWLSDIDAVQPGDVIGVRHSPWYPPREESIGHVGVIGADGYVYDFVKLKSWRQARYGRTEFAWFIHNCAPQEVSISRLRAEYRYKVRRVRASE